MQTDSSTTRDQQHADANSLYLHSSLQKAYSYLQYALHTGEGLVLVTGQPGTGKTALLQHLIKEQSSYDTSFNSVDCAHYSGAELLSKLASEWGISVTGITMPQLISAINTHLLQLSITGKRIILLLDEAQFLTDDALEAVRQLSNLSTGGSPLLQIFLVGQPELRERLLKPAFTQLHQRIIATCNMELLSATETREYVIQQLSKAHWQNSDALPASVFNAIHRATLGTPRWINLICNRMMIQAIATDRLQFSLEDICVILQELIGEDLLPEPVRRANQARASVPPRSIAAKPGLTRLEVAA